MGFFLLTVKSIPALTNDFVEVLINISLIFLLFFFLQKAKTNFKSRSHMASINESRSPHCAQVFLPLTILNLHNCEKFQEVSLTECRLALKRTQTFDWKFTSAHYPSLSVSLSILRWTTRQRNVLHSSECVWKKLLPWYRSGQKLILPRVLNSVAEIQRRVSGQH